MKKLLIVISLFFVSLFSYSQTTPYEIDSNIYTLDYVILTSGGGSNYSILIGGDNYFTIWASWDSLKIYRRKITAYKSITEEEKKLAASDNKKVRNLNVAFKRMEELGYSYITNPDPSSDYPSFLFRKIRL